MRMVAIFFSCLLFVPLMAQLSHAKIEPQYDRLVLVFIPGIYGSILKAPDGTVLWGENGIGPKGLSLTSHPDAVPSLFSDVRFNVFLGAGKTVRGYSGFRERAALLLDSKPLVFAYDWRKSNRKSAQELQKFLCRNLSEIEKPYRIVFVAHSMGGLVLRHWLNDYLGQSGSDCAGVTEGDIGKIIFAGTPHLGAMETVVALLEGKSALEDNPIYASLFTGGLAAYAATFESAYELLPAKSIAGSGCSFVSEIFDENKLVLNVGTAQNRGLYLNYIDKWKQLSLPEELPKGLSREDFYKLSERLIDSASKVVCELNRKPVDVGIARKMSFIVGQMKDFRRPDVLIDNTWDHVEVKKEPNAERTWNGGRAKGDGTVPVWSAGPSAVRSLAIIEAPQRADKEHSQLLDDPLVISHIEYEFQRVATEIALLSLGASGVVGQKKNFRETFAEVLDTEVGNYSPEVAESTVRHLAELAKSEGLSAIDIYRDAKGYSGVDSEAYKAIGFSTAAAMGDQLNPISNFWAYQNSAVSWLKTGNEQVAIGVALAAGEQNKNISSTDDVNYYSAKFDYEGNEQKWKSVVSSQADQLLDKNVYNTSFDVKGKGEFVIENANRVGFGAIKF